MDRAGVVVLAALLAGVGLVPAVVVAVQHRPLLAPLLALPAGVLARTVWRAVRRPDASRYDALTGLPNRQLLLERGRAAVARAGSDNAPVTLLLLDLDRFKEVNDTLGHADGDRLLKVVATRLESSLRPVDTVARLGGDEFGVLLPGVSAADATEVAARMRAAVKEPLHLGDVVVEPEVSIGVAVVPDHAADFERLMQRADVAMYLAKASGQGLETYAAERDRHSAARLGLLAELHRAIEQDELELHYQPKATLPGGAVDGVEALVRWRHPERGLMPPDQFIPAAEQSGLMTSLSRYVVEHALQQTASWETQGLAVDIAVNLSMRDLHDLTFVDFLSERLAAYDVPASRLVLEITEGMLMADPDQVSRTLSALAELGVSLSLDDFGTGYSSLVHLRRLPVSEVKIDRSFVQHMDVDEDDATIVRSIIELADALGLRVVAEGVETEESWRRLARMGCDAAQGWYLSKALPADRATVWLRDVGRADPVLTAVNDIA